MDGIEILLILHTQSASVIATLSEKGNAINLAGIADLSLRQSLTYTTTGEPKTATLPTPPIRKFPFPADGTGHKSIASCSSLSPLTHNSELIDQIPSSVTSFDRFQESKPVASAERTLWGDLCRDSSGPAPSWLYFLFEQYFPSSALGWDRS